MEVEVTPHELPRRWVTLLLYCLSTACNGMTWVTCSPITNQISSAYGVSTLWVEMCSLSFMAFYIPVNFPSNYLLDRFGLKLGVLAGVVFTAVGCWVRCGSEFSYGWILAGQSLCAIGQPFLLNCPAKVAALWFRPDMRTTATTIGASCNYIGVAIGFVLPSLFVSSSSKSDITLLMFTEAVIVSVVAVLVLLLFKSKPSIPPSVSAGEQRAPFCKAIKKLVQTPAYMLLFFAFSMGLGTFNALATMIQPLITHYGFSSANVSLFGALIIISGLIGSAVICLVVTKTHAYKRTILCLFVTATCFSVVYVFTLSLKSLPVTACVIFVMGFVLTPALPVSYELGCEITYPIGEEMSGGLLNTGGQIVGILQVGVMTALLEYVSSFVANVQIIGFIGIGTVGALLVKEELVRAKKDTHDTVLDSLHDG